MKRETMDFNKGWLFRLGEATREELLMGNVGFACDETRVWQKAGNHGLSKPENKLVDAWRKLDLPHDFAIEGEFTKDSSLDNGSLRHGEAWYVKKFELPASDEGKSVRVEFDGVYRDCQVWLNGNFVGRKLSGYASFSFELTELCRFGELNALAVFVDASESELWSYEGAGVYRSVRLVKSALQHIPRTGVRIRTGGEDAPGECEVEAAVENKSFETAEIEARCLVLSPEGEKAAEGRSVKLSIPPFESRSAVFKMKVEKPKLWSVETPCLHSAVVSLAKDGEEIDSTTTSFGFRFFRFDPDKGFFLNGKSVKLKGVCCHQDCSGVGVAAPKLLQEWRIRKLKELGCNALRTSHNPPDPALLDACDKLGLLVMDEQRLAGACEEMLGQLEGLILRDRNHPSVILWSLGNEEMGVQKTLTGVRIFRRMQMLARKLDPGRPTTYATNCDWPAIRDFQEANGLRFDVFGANYTGSGKQYDDSHAKHPDWPMLGSETWGGGATRGLYEPEKAIVPLEMRKWAVEKEKFWGGMPELPFASAYGNWRTPWGYSIEECWQDCASRPFMAGTFLWTGFDYRGETTPYGWPATLTRFGILDYCGFYKEIAHYLRAWWRPEEPHIFLMPHWNWEGREGESRLVRCYSNMKEVELSLNGELLGRKKTPENGSLEWQVAYKPGVLTAKGFDEEGKLVASTSRVTAKAPKALQLSCEIERGDDGEALAVVSASVVDEAGVPCPRACDTVEFSGSENVELLGVGNGDPLSHEKDKGTNVRSAYHGLCQGIFRFKAGTPGLSVEAKARGLRGARVELR